MVTVRRLHVSEERLLSPQKLRPAVGVLALATDANVESELRTLIPSTIRTYTTRICNTTPLTPEAIHRTANGIIDAGHALLPGQPLDALVYACTAGAAIIGADRVKELLRRARPSALHTSPIHAAVLALRSLGIERLAILTPNVGPVNAVIGRCFIDHGFDVRHVVGLDFFEDSDIAGIPPEVVVDAAVRSCDSSADGLLICCTTLRVSPVIEEIERVLGCPVITSNQAVAWEIAESLGVPHKRGFGSLLGSASGVPLRSATLEAK